MSAPALDPVVQWVLRTCLALLFGLAAVHKLRAPRAFAALLAEYRLLPARVSLGFGLALALAELAVAALLCLPSWHRAGALAAAALLAAYGVAVAQGLWRGRAAIDCGCGLAPRPLGADLVVRNALLAGLALLAALPALPRALGWVDALSVVAATATAALLFAAADTLTAERARSAA